MKPHIPVLRNQAVDGLRVSPGRRFIDATFGAGGHASEIVRRGGEVLGIDVDPDTPAPVHGNFRDIERIAKAHGFYEVDGILFDLGVSSHQLDSPERGFSFRFDAPLDMRLGKTGETAGDFLQHISESELYEILAKFGEIDRARQLAHAISRARPIRTTGDLLHGVGRHDAPQVFQALRIVVNDEIGALKAGLAGARMLLRPGGRLVVISFHSLEDRVVKQFMQSGGWNVITKKPIRGAGEANPRARSAKLRIAEKL